jgi:transcriptional regulator with XRE-family HTH domain
MPFGDLSPPVRAIADTAVLPPAEGRYGLRMSKDAQDSGFGAYLVDAIDAAGFDTSTQFARAVDVDPSVVRRWINGQQRPTLRLLERVAPALKKNLNDLVRAAYPENASDGAGAAVAVPLHPLARDVDVLLGPKSRLADKDREALETVLAGLLEPYRSRTGRRRSA